MNSKTETEQEKMEPEGIPIFLQWGDASQIPTIYANHLYITHSGGEFYLVFGELAPIINIDKDNPPDYLEIKPVVKVAILPKNMLEFAKVIQTNIDNFQKALVVQENDEENQ